MNRLWVALTILFALLGSNPASASCAASEQYNFAFASLPAATLSYGSTYNYAATTSGGASQPFSLKLTQNGLSSTLVANTQMPAISTLVTGSNASLRDLVFGGIFSGRTTSITGTSRVIVITFTFAQPIRDFSITLNDIDYTANQYREWLMVTGVGNGVTYTPAMSSPPGNSNAVGGFRTATGSAVTFGTTTTPFSISTSEVVGVDGSDNNSDQGDVTVTFPQPVTTVTVRYGNAPYSKGENTTGQQGAGIAGISFCPMPQIAVAKTSAPLSGTLGAYNLPGSDILYTLTVTNTGGSPVDASSIVLSDVLPTGVTFRNTVLDTASGTPFSINAGSSGVSLAAGSPAYSNNGGSTWSYAPASGYDANVRAVRVTPNGTMAAHSSFSISFVARIN